MSFGPKVEIWGDRPVSIKPGHQTVKGVTRIELRVGTGHGPTYRSLLRASEARRIAYALLDAAEQLSESN